MDITKRYLRKKAFNYLNSISIKDKKCIEFNQYSNLMSSSLWKKSKTIGITYSQPLEWDTSKLIKLAWSQGKKVALPRCIPDSRQLDFFIINSFDQLENVYQELLEPVEVIENKVRKNDIDLLIVPGLLFDCYGYRIGFGGGYYDRYLTNYKNITLSICSSAQLIKEIPREPYDIPVDYLVTEDGIQRTK